MEFERDVEYHAFKAWATEGSTIGQRMNQGSEPAVPKAWPLWRKYALVYDLPETLEEFEQQYPDNLKLREPSLYDPADDGLEVSNA